MGSELVRITTYVEKDQLEQLKELSKKSRISQAELVREALDDLLEKYKDVQFPFRSR